MEIKRKGEEKESPCRSGRYYTISNEWYFSVRETKDCGPYASKELAEEALKIYLADIADFNANGTVLSLSEYKR